MNFEKIKIVKVLEFIFLRSLKLMIRSKELLHIDTPEYSVIFFVVNGRSSKLMENTNSSQVRCSRYLYTLVVQDREKAEKLKQSLPPGLAVKELK